MEVEAELILQTQLWSLLLIHREERCDSKDNFISDVIVKKNAFITLFVVLLLRIRDAADLSFDRETSQTRLSLFSSDFPGDFRDTN
jgi:hypothetical protein